jgi:signal transduction histidine kinase
MSPSLATAAMPAREQQPHEPATVVRRLAQELRQPLATIESISHYLNMVLPRTEAKARRQLSKLQDEVRHMHWILADALHFLQAAPLNLHLLDLTEVVSKNLSEWSSREGVSLEFDLDPDLPLAQLDLEQMQHLLRNSVTFFRRISTAGRPVRLRTYSAAGEVALEITSEALEFAPEDLEPLFEPFEEHFPAGSGLALASARKIAEAHGARVSVTSDPPKRLTLSIAFPAA